MPKISIIVPVYNTENYIDKCIESILNQSVEDIQLIVVDDGSTDNSLKILKEYEKNNQDKMLVLSQENAGQGQARNHALKHATGDYLGFVDSDDWIDETMVEEMLSLAEKGDRDIVICDTTDHYSNRDVYHHASAFDNKFTVTPSACNKIFKRSFVGDIHFPVGVWYEDFCFTTKLLFKTDNIDVIHKSFYHCHVRDESTMTNQNSLKNLDMIFVLDELKNYLIKENLWEANKGVFNYFLVDHVLISTINRVAEHKTKEKKEVIAKLRKYTKDNDVNFALAKNDFSMPSKRVLVAKLNYSGMHWLSQLMLSVTALLKGK